MSATVTQIKQGIATALATIPGLRGYAYQPDNLNPPFAWPMLDTVTYNGAMRGGLITHIYTVTVVVGRAAERTAQTALDGLIRAQHTAIEANSRATEQLTGAINDLKAALIESTKL